MRTPYPSLALLLLAACGDNIPPPADAPGVLTVTVTAPTTEGGTFTITARRTDGAAGAVSVSYATADAGATAGADYEAATGELTWADGDSGTKTARIAVLPDLAVEGDEGLTLTLGEPTGGASLAGPVGPLTIIDDDAVASAALLTSGGRLVTLDPATPTTLRSAAAITGVAGSENLLAIDVRPADGVIYALGSAGTLYTVDPATGVATLQSTLVADAGDATAPFTALTGARFGLDFNPVVDRLRIVSDTGQNLRVNVDTGATTTDTAINGGATGYAAVAYTQSFGAACRTALYAIDSATGRLLVQSPPNDGVATVVGTSLGVAVDAVRGFDVATDAAAANQALAVIDVAGATSLHTIDLAAGTASAVGAIALAEGEEVVDLALATPTGAVAQPAGELLGLSAAGRLVSFTRAAPAKLCTSMPITGVNPGATLADLDVRPSTGGLHALAVTGNTGTLYTVDAATGAASSPVNLSAALVGTRFGIDFNPTGAAPLRIVSDAGQNLRVTDLAAGTTVVDTALNGAATGAASAGYTDAVPGAGSTALYVIDTAADRLRRQDPPNAGTLIDVGALGADLAATTGFDIDGRDNVAYLTANAGGATSSTLHTLDLATGAASASLGTIGGGEVIVGVTRSTPTTTVFGLTDQGVLTQVSLTSPDVVTTIGAVTVPVGETLVGLDLRPSSGLLYGLGATGALYLIDPTTAAATKVADLAADAADVTAPYAGLLGTGFGMDFNPTGAVPLRIVSDAGENLRIANPATGAVTTDTDLARAPRTHALAAIAYAGNTAGSTATALYGLDSINDRLVAITPPNTGAVREIGALGIDVGAVAAFEIVAGDTALAVVSLAGTPTLVTINLTTGAATSVGAVDVAGVAGIAAPISAATPAATSAVYAVTTGGSLVAFARNAPGTVTTIGALTGVGVTETVIGVDMRTSTDELWVLTRGLLGAGRLYRVDTTTADATLVATLSADAADTTAPYASLSASVFDIDFNPTGGVGLRIIGSGGENLRVPDPTTGATFTDGTIGVPAPSVVAAGYTNSFAAPTGVTLTTSLYVIDAATGSLLLQSPPNVGTLSVVGALSPSATFAGTGGSAGGAAFDIAGGNNGVVLAALQRTTGTPLAAEAFSRLYRVNLTTGAATELGSGIGGRPLVGLAIRVR